MKAPDIIYMPEVLLDESWAKKEEDADICYIRKDFIIKNRLKDLLPELSVPSNLEDATKKKARKIFDSLEKHSVGEEKNRILLGLLELEAFAMMFSQTGAEWMLNQLKQE